MSITRAERLVNLVIALLSTRQFLTAEQIRETVMGYPDDATEEAYNRMFERDKAELRDLGVPLETGRASWHSQTEGYRINRDAYELPDIQLTHDEAAAVAVAAHLWQSPELHSATQSALLKLRAGGVPVDDSIPVAAMPLRTRGSETVVTKLLAAVDDGRVVRFSHRRQPSDPYVIRTVEPWGLTTWRGKWYLVGFDQEKRDTRTFRLSRIAGDVEAIGPAGTVHKPADADLREIAKNAVTATVTGGSAQVWVADGRAFELRRIATAHEPAEVGGRPGTVLDVPASSWEWLARVTAGHGPDALVLEPQALRTQVIELLEGAVAQDAVSEGSAR
ncbi:WYL domain-containing protein [Hoyosella sp. YIM 151337]|uniref:helix-turn-helix transcriptional regulator n=1 Tax=Hoyosella sp. YIM 151337 TaxID=2992742 RepID=UPI00223605A5|nr:WYL domain-containing protein [Hoyosella sp. YIM 151337]MCW4353071.1 WYL domain-containing protein [Hoyosella sp. YIM 151337]